MSEKVIAIMNKPANCQVCVFGVCKYSLPLTTRRKGYYCQLKEPKARIVEDFDYNAEIHLSNCPLKRSNITICRKKPKKQERVRRRCAACVQTSFKRSEKIRKERSGFSIYF